MASRSLNKVILIGNLTRDPELRYTPSGTAVCTFGLATNRSWVTDSGEKKEEAEFHRIVAWHKLAEICGKFLSKGRKVYLEGRLQTRSWTGQDNQQRQTTEIVIDDMIILDSRRMGDEGAAPYDASANGGSHAKPTVSSHHDDQKATVSDQKKPVHKKSESVKKETKKEAEENVPAEDIPF